MLLGDFISEEKSNKKTCKKKVLPTCQRKNELLFIVLPL